MNALISVIIPVYNHAATIERSVQSLIGQTYRPLQVVFVNDGSTDNFQALAEPLKIKAQQADIEALFIRQENKGAPAARNRGFTESTGQYVLFWDADTIAEVSMIEKMYAALQMNQAASYAYSQFKFGWKKMRSQPFVAADLQRYNYIDTTSLIRRQDFSGFDESLKRFQDWDLWLTMFEEDKIGIFVPEVLFTKETAGRKGLHISNWLPSFVYALPLKNKHVADYERARQVVLKKHGLIT